MSKSIVEISHCLLGIGYTSILASHLLKEKGINSIILGFPKDKAVFELKLSNCSISPLPIFPVKDSFLFEALKLNESIPLSTVEVNYSEVKNCNYNDFKIHPNSLGEFIYKDDSALKAFGLSLKQWGESILTYPLTEVQNKIKRHYLSGTKNTRVGYLNGFTLYYHFLQKLNPDILNFTSLEKIDFKNKIVFTDSYEIHYKKLISTIPINHLLTNCNFEIHIPPIYEGSYFFYFNHSSEFLANKIIYDCDLNSNILRVFSATDSLIVVQLPSYKRGQIKVADISQRLRELVPTLKELNFEQELFMPMSYPIESITDSQTLENIHMLKENSVLPFGRFGNWEYSDLHELNWESIL